MKFFTSLHPLEVSRLLLIQWTCQRYTRGRSRFFAYLRTRYSELYFWVQCLRCLCRDIWKFLRVCWCCQSLVSTLVNETHIFFSPMTLNEIWILFSWMVYLFRKNYHKTRPPIENRTYWTMNNFFHVYCSTLNENWINHGCRWNFMIISFSCRMSLIHLSNHEFMRVIGAWLILTPSNTC